MFTGTYHVVAITDTGDELLEEKYKGMTLPESIRKNTDRKILGSQVAKVNLIFTESPSFADALKQLATSCIFHHYCQMGRGDENLQIKRLA